MKLSILFEENNNQKIVKIVAFMGVAFTILAWIILGLGYSYSLIISNEFATDRSIMTPRGFVQTMSLFYGWVASGAGFLFCSLGLALKVSVKGIKIAFIFASLYFLPFAFALFIGRN